MHTAQTSFETQNARKYLQQLCKHFAHKVEVEYGTSVGNVDFKFGQADLTASDDRLELTVKSAGEDELQRTKQILEDHLVRFAFREKLSGLNWTA